MLSSVLRGTHGNIFPPTLHFSCCNGISIAVQCGLGIAFHCKRCASAKKPCILHEAWFRSANSGTSFSRVSGKGQQLVVCPHTSTSSLHQYNVQQKSSPMWSWVGWLLVMFFAVCHVYWGVCPKGHQKLVATVRLSTRDWSSFQLAITTHQQSFTHNGIARGAKILCRPHARRVFIQQCAFSSYFALRKTNVFCCTTCIIIFLFLLILSPGAGADPPDIELAY